MDNPLGHDVAHHLEELDYSGEDSAIEAPPQIGGDERRMHVRAYNYWASLLRDRRFPSIKDLEPADIEDFAPYSLLLDFTTGIENPALPYLGSALRQECDIYGQIGHIADVPSRSLLSRLTDHYLQIIANGAPIGFEAEFLNQRGTEILYRGILMPFSSNDDTIDFIYGVINWKEVADRNLTDELVAEVGQALRRAPIVSAGASTSIWADGPSAALPEPLLPVDCDGMLALAEPALDAPLADWLALARDLAGEAQAMEDRSHSALYRAIGLAYDFALIAQNNPQEYAELLQDAGIKVQARAPMTPIVKLIFGAGYDKTRLAEYATALDHARGRQIARGTFAAYLESQPGGLKALVRNERLGRKKQGPDRPNPVHEARRKLRTALAIPSEEISTDEEGLAVLVGRREEDGSFSIIASLDVNSPLVAQVVRKAAA